MSAASVSDRLTAISRLGNRLNSERLVTELVNLLGENINETVISFLNDSNVEVRSGAALTLGLLKVEQAIQPLVTTLYDEDIRLRTVASSALSMIGNPAVEALISAFHNTDDGLVKFHVIAALNPIEDVRVIDLFLEALSIQDTSLKKYGVYGALIKKYAVYGLANWKDQRAVEPLLKLLSRRDGDRNETATAVAEVLAGIGDTRAIRPIFRAMVAERIWVAQALGEFGEPAVTFLLSNLKAKSPKRRSAAASALGELREQKAVEPLIALLQNDPDGDTRSSAAFALGFIGDIRALAALTFALNDPHEYTRFQAARALEQLKS